MKDMMSARFHAEIALRELTKPFGIEVVVQANLANDILMMCHLDSQGLAGGGIHLLTRPELLDHPHDWMDIVINRAEAALGIPLRPRREGIIRVDTEQPIDPILRDIAEGRGLDAFMEE